MAISDIINANNSKWDMSPIQKDIQNIEVGMTVTYGTKVPDDIIKAELANQISKEIMARDLIKYRQDVNSMNPFETKISAQIRFVPPYNNDDKVVVFNDVIKINGTEFNTDQVKEALENTFPEYFI